MIATILGILLSMSEDEYQPQIAAEPQGDTINILGYRTHSPDTPELFSGSSEEDFKTYSPSPPVSPVVDVCSDPSFRDVVERVCDVPLVCAEAAGLQSAHGFTDANLRGLGFKSGYSADQIGNYAACRPTISEDKDDDEGPSLADLVEAQWRQVQLPAPVITTNPKDGKTLANMDTWVQARQDPVLKKVTLLGQDVWIKADPLLWHWDYGDDTPVVTNDHSGYEYPTMKGFHHYRKTGNYQLTVTIEWAAQYTLKGDTDANDSNNADGAGEWINIPGTGTTTNSIEIQVDEHLPRLVH